MYHLICVQPFGQYKKGDRVTAADEVAMLIAKRDSHFVKVPAPVEGSTAAPPQMPALGFDE